MSDQNHVEILRRGPRAWNAWRTDNPAAPANLNGITLKLGERQLGPINGGPINLRGAHLRAAKLRYASLLSANLEGAELADADLTHARLDGANLAGADLSNAALDHADLHAANLSGANLSGASLLEVRNLSQKQLDDSLGDGTTLLPPRLARPARWSASTLARVSAERAPLPRAQAFPTRAFPAKAYKPERDWTRPLVTVAIIALLGAGGVVYMLRTGSEDLTGSVERHEASKTVVAAKHAPAIPIEPRGTDLRAPDLISPSPAPEDVVGDAPVPPQQPARHGTDPDRVSPPEEAPLSVVSPAEEAPLPPVAKVDPPAGDVPPTAVASVGPQIVPAAPPGPAANTALPQDDVPVTTVPDAVEAPPPLPSRKPAARSIAAIPAGVQEGITKTQPQRPATPSAPKTTPDAAGRAAVSDVLAGGL